MFEEEFKFNDINFPKLNQDNSDELFSNLKSYDITEIKAYKNRKNIKDKLLSKQKEILNDEINNCHKTAEKPRMSFIKSLIKEPEKIFFDGYLRKRKKPTINYLLKKTNTKENKKLLEENMLFKNPYPLIKYLSNRKMPNKSRQLITDILSAELNKLSIEQKMEMKYKPAKSLIKLTKVKYPKIKINQSLQEYNNYSLNNPYLKTHANFSVSIMSKKNNPNIVYDIKHSLKNINLNKMLNRTYFSKKISNVNRRTIFIKNNNNLNDFKENYNNNNKFIEHTTMTDNISYIRKSLNKKLEIKDLKHIVKDISILKYNNHIMPLNY